MSEVVPFPQANTAHVRNLTEDARHAIAFRAMDDEILDLHYASEITKIMVAAAVNDPASTAKAGRALFMAELVQKYVQEFRNRYDARWADD